MEKTRGDLQQYHNEALKNPEYRMEGLLDVRMEELLGHLPRRLEATGAEPVATPQEPWTASQWDIVVQLRCEIAYLNRKFLQLEQQPKVKGKQSRWK